METKLIYELIDRFNAGTMTELDFSDGGSRLRLRRAGAPSPGGGGARTCALKPADTEGAPSVHLAIPAEAAGADPEAAGTEYIRSPVVAVFYASSGPDAPPFVRAGTTVKAGQVLCILEAMKMMNKLEAEFDCEVTDVKVSSGDMVEYGQPLFEVRRH
ncbi:MAG: acetyl-CoA carboxylase biotin carboxyl carrier protein [Spirochaetaceae bacterium]|jgi:acetyl-CoA carboxylase biotin carboxyl carrier protein|nr:acetyl-CoA carboxylase biotin carboxyl carrier protein [Spirochaetaceae bacterium]